MSSIGFLVYSLFIFLPGVGLGELTGLWEEQMSLASKVAYAFGLGLCLDTFVLVVKTSGLGPGLSGIGVSTIYGMIAFGLVCLVISVVRRKKLRLWTEPTRYDLALCVAMLIEGAMIAVYFQKYPIFPEYQTPDYAIHVQDAQSLLSGSLTSIPSGILYFGVHLQLASCLLLVGGPALVTARWAMAILAAFSPLLIYLAAQMLFKSTIAAAIAGVLYALSGTVWFGAVFDSGLYANFFGILIALVLIAVFLDSTSGKKKENPGVWVALILAVIASYFSHYTILTVFPALVAYAVFRFITDRTVRRPALVSSLVVLVPGMIGILLYPNFTGLLGNVNSAGGIINGGTLLSKVLAGYPVLGYMALETYDDVAFVVALLLAGVYVWRTVQQRSPNLALPLAWLVALLVASPLNDSAWRYSFEALVPLTLIAAFGLFSLLPKVDTRKGRRASVSTQQKMMAIIVLVLLPLTIGSWGTNMVNDAATGTSVYAQAQLLVNDSISWLGAHTPQNSSYLSVSDWRFTYTSLFIDRPTTYAYISDPDEAINYSVSHGLTYIIVTNLVPESVQGSPENFPWNTFPQSSTGSLTLVYSNTDVRIYQIP